MQRLHTRLCATFTWYNNWHKNAESSTITWALFILVSITYTTALVSIITISSIDLEGTTQVSGVQAALTRGAIVDQREMSE